MESSEHTKLFVGGVSRETTEDTLRQYFSRFGQVEESLIIRDRLTGIARGFGFVTLSNSSLVSEALRVRHVILGRTVDVKPAKTKSNRQEHSSVNGSNANSNTLSSKKIFVGGLPHNLAVEEFKSYFEKFGTVTDVVVIFDKENHRPRGFGFITFDSEEAVDKVLQNSFYELKNKMVEVKRAQPKDKHNCYDYYDCYNTGLGFMYSSPYHSYSAAFQPHGYYGRWNPHPFGPSTGGWVPPVAAPSSSSHHGYLASGNPSFHTLVPCFGGIGIYMNGWTSGAMDWTSRNGNLNRDLKSVRGNSNSDHDNDSGSNKSNEDHDNDSGTNKSNKDHDSGSNNSNSSGNARRDYDSDEVEVPLKNSESNSDASNSGEHQMRVIDDSSASLKSSDEELCLRSNAKENQSGEFDDSSGLKGIMNENREIDESSCLKGSAAEHQEGEHQKEDDLSVQKVVLQRQSSHGSC